MADVHVMIGAMDPFFWRTVSYVVVFIGTGLVLIGSVGTWYFGNRVEEVAPFRQPIRGATSTVEVQVQSTDDVDTVYADRGGLLAFAQGAHALMTTAATEASARQLGDDRVRWRGVFTMDANDLAVGRPVTHLGEADYVQIEFEMMPENAQVLGGRAIVVVNNAVRLEIPVPAQTAAGRRIFVRDLTGVFADFP